MDRDRLPEQREVLDEIVRICEERDVSLVLVAGDVFDTYMPSAESEELFFSAMKQLAGEDRAVVVISGNHDDAVRLSFFCTHCSGARHLSVRRRAENVFTVF